MANSDKSLARETFEVADRVLEPAGSVARNTALKLLEKADEVITGDKRDSSIPYSDIAYGKRFMRSEDFIKGVMNVFGMDYQEHGDNTMQSVAKVGLELAVDLATDPITYIPFGNIGSIGSKISKAVSKLAPKAVAKIGETAVKNVAKRTLIGGTAGALYPVAEDENQILGRAKNALKGAAITNAASPIANAVVKTGFKAASDMTIDSILKSAKPEVFEKYGKSLGKDLGGASLSPSKFNDVIKRGKERFAGVTRNLNKMNDEIIRRHGPDEVERSISIFDENIPHYVNMRKQMESLVPKGKLTWIKKNEINRILNDSFRDGLKKAGKWTPAMDDLVKRNRYIISEYNEANKLYRSKVGKPYRPLTGIDIHTPEIFSLNTIGSYGSPQKGFGFLKRGKTGDVETGGLSGINRMLVENDSVIYSMMNVHERNAVRFMSELANTKSKAGFYSNMEKHIGMFDDITKDMKGAMLTLSHSWVKNNFIENTIRAYAEHGVKAGAGAAGKQIAVALSRIPKIGEKISNSIAKDLRKVTATEDAATGYIKFADKTGLTEVARDTGVLNGGMYKEIMGDIADKESKALLIAKVGKARAEEKLLNMANKGAIGRTKDNILGGARKIIGETGSLIENTARLNTFEHAIKNTATKAQIRAIEKFGYKKAAEIMPELKIVYKDATDIVDKTFFDYSDLSFGEERIMKRLFPFYSFYSKNLMYWGDIISDDIVKLNRTEKLLSQAANMDKNESLGDRLQYSQYERSIPHGKDKDGRILTMGNTSMTDFLDAIRDPSQYFLGKVHPLLSGSVDVARIVGRKAGAFDEPKDNIGRNLLVSDSPKKKRKAYYQENKLAQIDELLGSPLGSMRADDGTLEVTSDIIPAAARTLSAIAPIPILDSAARLIETGDIISELSPVRAKEKTYSEKLRTERRNRQQVQKNSRERLNERLVEIQVDNYNGNPSDNATVNKIHDNDLNQISSPIEGTSIKVINNNDKMPKSPVNPMGLKSSPWLIDTISKNNPFSESVSNNGIGYGLKDTYVANDGQHKNGQKIKPTDTITKGQAAVQLITQIRNHETILDKHLKSSGIKVTKGIYDAIIHAGLQTGTGSYSRLKNGSISNFFQELPATVVVDGRKLISKKLIEQRTIEFNKAKEESEIILKGIIEAIENSALTPAQKLNAIKDSYKMYGFPDSYTYKGELSKKARVSPSEFVY